ncbi:MAG: hypothetical protein MI923_19280 [Phycisphaerales bacterium]|nr:hypothetical protein [Phycisphaerales bacterium]
MRRKKKLGKEARVDHTLNSEKPADLPRTIKDTLIEASQSDCPASELRRVLAEYEEKLDDQLMKLVRSTAKALLVVAEGKL